MVRPGPIRRRGGQVAALLIGAAFLGAAAPLAAEGPPQQAARRVRVMVAFRGPEGPASADYEKSLEATLIQSPAVLALVRASPGEEDLATRAGRGACPLALELSLGVDAEASHLEWKIYAPPREDPVDEGRTDKGLPDARILSTTFWLEPIAALEGAIASAEIPSSYLRIVAEPGTRVSGIGEDLEIPESGSIDVPLVLPAYLVWSAEAEGARKESGKLLVEESGTSLVIPRRPPRQPSPWSLEASALGLSFPELSARYEIGPRLFLRARFTQYLLGLSLQNSSESLPHPSIIASYSLIEPGIGIGYLISPRSPAFRFYASFDLFARIAFPEGKSIFFDPVAPLGTNLSLGVDWGRGPDARLFLETGVAIYPWAYPGLMLASWSGEGMKRIVFGNAGHVGGYPGWFAEFPVPRLGLRFRL